jgi:D-beta-D-heptose 7-phosphate kinase/D-beta-D-heptose 1-phosphate adenosyltransferase
VEPASAISAVERLRGRRVVVIGDVMVDEFLRGEVSRISPEAPVPVLVVRERETRLGGAANAAANIAALGGAAALVGVVGPDAEGELVAGRLAAIGITGHLVIDPALRTTKKSRLSAQGQQIVRVDEESRHGPAAAAIEQLTRDLDRVLADADACVLSDYGKGVITREVSHAAIERARARGIPLIVDPKQRDLALYRGATVVTPNLNELERFAGANVGTLDEIEAAVARLLPGLDGGALLVTRSAEGMTLFRPGARRFHMPALAKEVFDVTGAGDTVVATLALALAAGLDFEIAVELCSVAAGISVSKRGTSTVTPVELLDALGGG